MDDPLDVELNVYDLWDRNRYLYPIGCGAYHSGLVLRSGSTRLSEITFGGHPYDMSGIFGEEERDRDRESLTGEHLHVGCTNTEHLPGSLPQAPDLAPRTTVFIGTSRMPRREVAAVVACKPLPHADKCTATNTRLFALAAYLSSNGSTVEGM